MCNNNYNNNNRKKMIFKQIVFFFCLFCILSLGEMVSGKWSSRYEWLLLCGNRYPRPPPLKPDQIDRQTPANPSQQPPGNQSALGGKEKRQICQGHLLD